MKKINRKVERLKGATLGLDIHKVFIEWCLFDAKGNEKGSGRIDSGREALLKLLAKWDGTPLQVAIEACGCFVWVFDLLKEKLGREAVHVAQPSRLHVIANSMEKNDANDAWWLTYFLYEGRLPEAFVAEGDLRELRIATRELRSETNRRGDLLRRFKAQLAQAGLTVPKNWHTTEAGRSAAEAVAKDVFGMRGKAVRRLLKSIAKGSKTMAYWRRCVEKLIKSLPDVEVLQEEMPGFGPILSATVMAELAPPNNYTSAKAYAKATGLTPGQRESGGRSTPQGITRAGSQHARWAYTRVVLSCMRCKKGVGVQIREWVQARTKYKPKCKVIVAAARKLAEGVWRLFAMGEVFDLAKAFPVKPKVA